MGTHSKKESGAHLTTAPPNLATQLQQRKKETEKKEFMDLFFSEFSFAS